MEFDQDFSDEWDRDEGHWDSNQQGPFRQFKRQRDKHENRCWNKKLPRITGTKVGIPVIFEITTHNSHPLYIW